jgi:hypothetical protein
MGDHRRGADPRMRRGDHLVARLHFQRGHHQIERIGAVGAGHATLDLGGFSELSIEIRSPITVSRHKSSPPAAGGRSFFPESMIDGLRIWVELCLVVCAPLSDTVTFRLSRDRGSTSPPRRSVGRAGLKRAYKKASISIRSRASWPSHF